MKDTVRVKELYDLTQSLAGEELEKKEYPWKILADIHELICRLGETLPEELYERRDESVWIARSAEVFDSAYIGSCCIIGERTQVRHGAFIRGDALVGNDCVIGNSVELKNVIIFNGCEVPHYNYVGDSVLGYHAHMGAGSITSNIRSDRKNIVIHGNERDYETGRRKIGALIGDWAEIGCNAVLNPGTVIGSHAMVYPTACVRGVVPASAILTNKGMIKEKHQ